MQQIVSSLENGTISLSDKFDLDAQVGAVDATPYFNSIGSEYTISFINLQDVSQLTTFKYDTLGMTDTRFLKNYYRISRDNVAWTEWYDLKRAIDNFPIIDTKDPLYLDIKWVRAGSSAVGSSIGVSTDGSLGAAIFNLYFVSSSKLVFRLFFLLHLQ
jgi:hypothetical protein